MSTKVERSDTHELYLAEESIKLNQNRLFFSNEAKQIKLREKRKASAEKLSEEERKEIRELSIQQAKLFPKGTGELKFVSQAANNGEVYDFIFLDLNGGRIAVSCKLAQMEDKAWRISTLGYGLNILNDYNNVLFRHPESKKALNCTYLQALTDKGMTIEEYLNAIATLIQLVILDKMHHKEDSIVLEFLIRSRLIGKGDFYKTTNIGGKLPYYPALTDSHVLEIQQESVIVKSGTVSFMVKSTKDSEVNFYKISIRMKFKDGKDKPISFSRNNAMKNLGATVRVEYIIGE